MSELIIIEPGRQERHYWLDLWRYRELFAVLAWRDLSVRYKQTVIGVLWAVHPASADNGGLHDHLRSYRLSCRPTAPYPIRVMVFAGMLPWTFFATGLAEASNSSSPMPTSSARFTFRGCWCPRRDHRGRIGRFSDQLLHSDPADDLVPDHARLADPPASDFSWFSHFWRASGRSLWITSFNVKYRDFRYVIPFIVQFGLYRLSGRLQSRAVIPEQWRLLYSLNPNGRRHRRVSLVPARRTEPALSAGLAISLLASVFLRGLASGNSGELRKASPI